MLQWFIRFPEFAEFTELLFHLGQNSIVLWMFYCTDNLIYFFTKTTTFRETVEIITNDKEANLHKGY